MPDLQEPIRRVFSVTELNNETKKMLEQRFFSVFVRGEVSNFSAPRSGHWYFTIKDESAQIRVVMFKQANFKHTAPKLGDELIIGGQLSFYRERGEIQIIANHIKPAGLGDLQQQFDQLKDKLLNEGLFEQARKKAIPLLAKKIAIITSPTGAVIQDISQICARRAPSIPLLLIPVRVQGDAAESEICDALRLCYDRKDLDLVILARGGGSLEDFLAFNSESVARAIAECPLPIISGIGHETDVSIADFVADMRAATPSEAAELTTAGFQNLRSEISSKKIQLSKLSIEYLKEKVHLIEKLSLKLKDPTKELYQITQKLDHLESQLLNLWKAITSDLGTKLVSQANGLRPNRISERIETERASLSSQIGRIRRELLHHNEHSKRRLTKAISLLETLNPLGTMTRGYSIVFGNNGEVVSSVTQVSHDESIRIQFKDGSVESKVSEINKDVAKNDLKKSD